MKYFLYIFISFSGFCFSQSLSYNLSKVAGKYAEHYLQPLVNAYGSNINSGFYFKSQLNRGTKNALNFYAGFQSFGSFIPNSDQTFSGVFEDRISYNIAGFSFPAKATITVNNSPTIFGSRNPGTASIHIHDTVFIAGIRYIIDERREQRTVGGALNTNFVPLFIPQIGVGTLYGTDVLIRWLPPIKIENYGSFGFFGFGIRHNISQYFPDLMMDIYIQTAFQNFNGKDSTGKEFLSSAAFALNFTTAKSFGIFGIYGGLQFESLSVDADYTHLPDPTDYEPNPPPVNIKFNLNGENNVRLLIGASLTFYRFVINLDYNISGYSALALGAGFVF